MTSLVSLPPPAALPSSDPDAALLARIGAKDPGALETLMKRYETDVYRMVSKLVSNRADVEELTQATFLAVWRTGERYRGEASVRTFLLSMAYNMVRNHWRSQRRRRSALFQLFRAREMAGSDAVPSPELAIESREALRRVLLAIEALPEPMREVLVLCELEGLPQAEVSVMLGIPATTLRTRLYHARKRLSRAVEERA